VFADEIEHDAPIYVARGRAGSNAKIVGVDLPHRSFSVDLFEVGPNYYNAGGLVNNFWGSVLSRDSNGNYNLISTKRGQA
jgi:hypothetical protein